MGQLDLKHATIYIKDGAAGSPAAAITGATLAKNAYAGDTRIYTTMTGLIAINQTVAITGESGSPPTHPTVSFTQSAGNTTSVSFAVPLLKDIAAGATLTIAALTGTPPNILEVKIGDGNLTYSEKRNIEYRRNRGLLDTVRQGQEEPIEVSFDLVWEFLKSDTGEPVTIEEALKQIGGAVAWVSSSIDPCEPYAVNLEIRYHPPCTGIKDELIILNDFRWESLDHNMKDGTIACKGNCNITHSIPSRVSVSTASSPMMGKSPKNDAPAPAAAPHSNVA